MAFFLLIFRPLLMKSVSVLCITLFHRSTSFSTFIVIMFDSPREQAVQHQFGVVNFGWISNVYDEGELGNDAAAAAAAVTILHILVGDFFQTEMAFELPNVSSEVFEDCTSGFGSLVHCNATNRKNKWL